MDKTLLKNLIQSTKSIDELEEVKKDFLNECEKHNDHLSVAHLLSRINIFSDAKMMFESLMPSLLSVKGGKILINKYTKLIKENSSLKTIYAYHAGLNRNETPEQKKIFINEALSIDTNIDRKEYDRGMINVIKLITEGFKMIDDKEILNTVKIDEKIQSVNESLEFLLTTPKTVKNLNEHINHVNNVSQTIVENKTMDIPNLDMTLEDVLNKKINNSSINVVESIFNENVDKEILFKQNKELCLSMIQEQRVNVSDAQVMQKLDEMCEKLTKKVYNYDTYTKDMLYMSELQDVLK